MSGPTAAPDTKQGPGLTVPGLVLLALAACVGGLFVYQATLDEAYVYALTRQGIAGLFDAWAEDPQALLPQLVAYPFGLVSDALWWLRLPSLAAFTGAVVATWWAARARFSGPVATAAAAMLAVSPLGMVTATDARWPAMALLSVVVAWGALFRALDGRGGRWWVLYAAAVIAGVYCNALVLMMIPAHLVPVLLAGRRALRPWAAALGVVALGTVPLLLFIRASDAVNPLVRVSRPTVTEIPGFAAALLASGSPDRVRQLAVLAAVAVVAAGLWTVRGRVRGPAREQAAIALAWAVIPTAAVFVVSQLGDSLWQTRYLVGTLPGVFLLVAWSASRLGPRARTVVTVAAIVGLAGMTLGELVDPNDELTRDWTRELAALRTPGTPVVFYESEGVQVAGLYDRQFRSTDGEPIVPSWDRTPVPADIVLLDNPTFDRLPPGPPDAAMVRRLAAGNGSLLMAIRPGTPEPPGVVWGRENCEVTARPYPAMTVYALSGCRLSTPVSPPE